MNDTNIADRTLSAFEAVVIRTLQAILVFIIALAILELLFLMYEAIVRNLFATTRDSNVASVPDLQRIVQRGFAAILLVILGLELLQTLRSYFVSHHVRLRIIFIVALIAVGRHIIQLDLEETHGMLLIGIGVLVASLAGSYFLIVRIASGPQEDTS
jgi:uncharacterized membrane protein (DUF373 family)